MTIPTEAAARHETTDAGATPDVSVLLVVRGEPRDRLDATLRAMAAQEGIGAVELLVAGPPVELAHLTDWRPAGAVATIRLVPNPGGARCAGLNRMLAAARAGIVARVDARSRPPADYLARCMHRLRVRPDLGVVGAIQRPVPGGAGPVARGIARTLANPWLLGGARYRRPGYGGPAETAYLGAFRRDELRAIGGFDERLLANEDFDACARYRARGDGVWVESGLCVPYEARAALPALWAQYHAFGRAKVTFWRVTGARPNRRQILALGGASVSGAALAALAVRRPGLALGAVALGGAAVATVDHVVAPEEPDLRVRAAALVAAAAVVGGWITGVATGMVTRGPGPPAGAAPTADATTAALGSREAGSPPATRRPTT
jgi:GT2 family glycosyltransferase